ncbi:glycosyltransferase [Acetoanaerobium noterae]|uniref:glycosyltransferase n=1 Tax=Acetoanaerobium noterae TaxID=745369 RepID=UPI0028A79D2C|nr:glycosyltransferase [Acetoanaerobium noterae]
MRVLQINAVNGIRSTGRIVAEISDYLNNIGHDGYIAYSDGVAYKNGYKIGSKVETKLHGLFSRIFGTQAYFSKYGTKKLLEYIEELNPDVIHLHNLHGNYINLRLLMEYIALEDIPTVLTLHDCWFYTGKCTHYTIDNCYKWQSECGNCPRLKKDNKSWFFDRTKKMYRDKKEWFGSIPRLAVVGVSDWITNEAKKSLLSSAQMITRIYNWIDLDVFRPVNTNSLRLKLNLDNKFIILGVASGWSNAKGLDKFIELSYYISEDMIILLIGNISKNIDLPKNIIHIDETHDVKELVGYYSLADVFLNLSIEETFGKVTAEALACGTPAIVLNSTANPELVGEGCGYILDNYDVIEILKYLKEIKRKNKLFYKKECIEFAKDNFSKNERISEYIELYKNLMAI